MLGTAFGILGVLLSGGLAFKAIQLTTLVSSGVQLSQVMTSAGGVIDAMIWVVIGAILIPIGYLAGYMSKLFAIFIWLADVGVWMLAAVGFGIAAPVAGIVGGIFVFILGVWFLYMGIAQLVNGTLNRAVIGVGKPMFKSPTASSET